MGKFGQKVVVNVDMSKYVLGFLAPSGFGKSTLFSRVAEKEFGEDGYIALDLGQEDGYATISGAIVETCQTFTHFKEVVDDIVANKQTDYKNLKVVIIDTIDAGFDICEQYTIKSYNREHVNDKDFRKATSINSVEGGFGHGLDRVIETFKTELARLKSVGVGFWFTGHCKEREVTDMFTGTTFTQLTTNASQRYFNSIKEISHIIGFGYYDRSVEHQDVGKENPVTKKKKGRDTITSETRKIKFRDDGYLVDAKSRFADITPEIALDVDEFIQSIKQAIEAAGGKPNVKQKVKPEVVKTETINELNDEDEDTSIDNVTDNESILKAKLINEIHAKFAVSDSETKKSIKSMLIENGYDGKLSEECSLDILNQIMSKFKN